MERTSDYWFMIEPYMHINIANGYMLYYLALTANNQLAYLDLRYDQDE